MKSTPIIFIIAFLTTALFAQEKEFSYKSSEVITVSKSATVNPSKIKKDWKVQITNLEMPVPGGNSYRSFLMRQKELQQKKSRNAIIPIERKKRVADDVIYQKGMEGNPFEGGVPNDNDIAISNGGMIVSVINSNIIFYDTQLDSMLKLISLQGFFDTLNIPAHKYDPKVEYDPREDRFVLVCLSGNTDSTSNIMMAFSTTNNPLDEWHLYAIPGDPNNENTWSDYPMIALTEKETFITINALINDTINTSDSWKFLFQETGIWQITTQKGYDGDTLEMQYHDSIMHQGRPIRNICPVKGGATTYGNNIYFLSNRNFDLVNDTFFVMEITGLLGDVGTDFNMDVRKSDLTYGLAPDGIENFGRKLMTNDSRVLGAYYEDDRIHFVQNSILTDSARAGIYHGTIFNVASTKDIHGEIIGDYSMDFGYPNISYTGKYPGDDEAIITFLHTSIDTFPGMSAVFYDEVSGYSGRRNLKEGGQWVTILNSYFQRWGDYTGSQTKYDEPGTVWVLGSYGDLVTGERTTSSWIANLASPDSSLPSSIGDKPSVINDTRLYPNPVNEKFVVEFELSDEAVLDIALYDLQGKLIKTFIRDRIKKGLNRFSFSLAPLTQGEYILSIKSSTQDVLTKKVIKL